MGKPTRATPLPKADSELEATFDLALRVAAPNAWARVERQYKFHPTRNWRVDFAFLEEKLVVEIEGGQWLGGKGGHTSGSGLQRDCEKYNALALMGFRLLRYTTGMIRKTPHACVEEVLRALAQSAPD